MEFRVIGDDPNQAISKKIQEFVQIVKIVEEEQMIAKYKSIQVDE